MKVSHHAARIMLVGEEPASRARLVKALQRGGYQNLDVIQDPQCVVDAYIAHLPDLILIDIGDRHSGDCALLNALQAQHDPVMPPIVVLAALRGKGFQIRALEAGARDFIAKPFNPCELHARVRNLLDAHWAHCFTQEQNSALDVMVQERTIELQRTRLQVVQRLGRAAEYRDNETGLHVLRMSKVSALLATQLGWCDARCDLMLHASPMHDVGKIGVPDAILLKPGKLDPHEWELMKEHAVIGAELLSNADSELLHMAREIALCHHEKWDGSGYPGGLKGEDIPIAARIVAVADVFDALMSKRPYKEAWAEADAVAYIRDNAGKHFDPAVVACFLDALPEILAICQAHAEPVAGVRANQAPSMPARPEPCLAGSER